MPLSYDLEIFPEYLIPKRKIRPKTFTSCGGHCAVVRCASGPQTILFCTRGRTLADDVLSLGPTPNILPPGAPHPQKSFPNFPKILGVKVEILIALYGDPKGRMW